MLMRAEQPDTGHQQQEEERYPMTREQVVAMLQQYKITPTRQRIEIAGYLFQRPQHLSADKILEGVNEAGHRVSRATVYNTMGLFAQTGLVKEVLIDRERVFYDSNNSSHHHIYNVDTGELQDVNVSQIQMHNLPEFDDSVKVVDTEVIFRVSAANH